MSSAKAKNWIMNSASPAWLLVKTADGKSGWVKIETMNPDNHFPNIEELHGFAG